MSPTSSPAIRKVNDGKVPTARHWFGYASVWTCALIANELKTLDAAKLAKGLENFTLPPEVALMPDKVFYRAGDHQLMPNLYVGHAVEQGPEPEDLFHVDKIAKGEEVALPVDETGCHISFPPERKETAAAAGGVRFALSMTQLILFNVFNGLIIGAFYALMALGLSLILNLSGVINFAHGGFLAIGAYLAYTLIPIIGFWGALVVAPLLTAVLGLIVERLLIRRVYGRDPLYSLLLTFGLAFILQDGARIDLGAGDPALLGPRLDVEFAQQRIFLPHRLSPVHGGAGRAHGARAVRRAALDAARHAHSRRRVRSRDGLRARRQHRTIAQLQFRPRHLTSPASPVCWRRGCSACSRPSAPSSSCRASSPSSSAGSAACPGTLVGGLLIGVASGLTRVFFPSASEAVIYVLMALVLLVRPRGLFGEEGRLQ